MRNIFISLSLLLYCVTAGYGQLPAANAVWMARNIVNNDSCDFYYASVTHVADPANPTHYMNVAWLVFVDEKPNEGWEHPCKYIYINARSVTRDYFVVDSVCPPADVVLTPAVKNNIYGEKATMKPYVPKILSNDPNPAAGNTYAVILNGGMCLASNNERYWNDCSFIYKTLRNTYGIPKPNIKVIMSDGTNEGNDLNMNVGGYASSPLDLDDDSIPDIEYAATKANLQTVLNEMAQKLTDDDHLMIFVTGHGGYDSKKQSSYLYLWNKVKLYPNELNNYLEPIDAGFISIVMGQCNSGGFIDPLKKTNRIIATACAENERSYGNTTIPFEEFLYHWTSAVNGYDAYGEKVNVKENIPIMDAQAYAARNDVYANDKAKYGHEVPQINYFTHSVAYDLSLANIPPVVDLCIDEHHKPVNSELTTVSYKKLPDSFFYDRPTFKGFYHNSDIFNLGGYEYWKCPYIWLRNQNDGYEVQTTENIIIDDDSEDKDVYLYAQVRNKGVKPYTAKNKSLKAYWSEGSVYITANEWKGIAYSKKETGGVFNSRKIQATIQPGGVSIVEIKRTFNTGYDDYETIKDSKGALCFLAFIKESNTSEDLPVDSNFIAETWLTDKLGQTNILHQHLRLDTAQRVPFTRDSLYVGLSNLSSTTKNWYITAKILNYMDSLSSQANVALRLSPSLMTSWNNGNQQCINIKEVDRANCGFHVDGDSASLGVIKLQPYQRGKIGIKCNFFAENAITEKKQFDVDVAVRDNATGQILGGETFRIIQYPRPAINPQIETTKINGKTTLTATNVSENVIYKWYNEQGELVGEGNTFAVPAGVSASSYRVKAEALSDGAISYSAMEPAESSTIKSVLSDPGSVNVIFEGPANSGTTLRLASATGNAPVAEYSVEAGSTACNIPADNLASGVYQVTMVENGVVVGTKKFTK